LSVEVGQLIVINSILAGASNLNGMTDVPTPGVVSQTLLPDAPTPHTYSGLALVGAQFGWINGSRICPQ